MRNSQTKSYKSKKYLGLQNNTLIYTGNTNEPYGNPHQTLQAVIQAQDWTEDPGAVRQKTHLSHSATQDYKSEFCQICNAVDIFVQ